MYTMHWLTDDDAWFIQTDIPNGLTWFWRRRPEFTKDNDFDSENAKFKTTFRASSGWSDWRGIFGSPGANGHNQLIHPPLEDEAANEDGGSAGAYHVPGFPCPIPGDGEAI